MDILWVAAGIIGVVFSISLESSHLRLFSMIEAYSLVPRGSRVTDSPVETDRNQFGLNLVG